LRIATRAVSDAHHSNRPKTNAEVIQRTLVCDSANIGARINDCSNKLVDDGVTEGTRTNACFDTMKKPLTALSILVIAALTMGMALAERMEQRAQQDRFSFGDTIGYAAQ
jgi:hypothetical protein